MHSATHQRAREVRRILVCFYATGLWPRLAMQVRGSSQRRITTMRRQRSANIRVINRRYGPNLCVALCFRPPPLPIRGEKERFKLNFWCLTRSRHIRNTTAALSLAGFLLRTAYVSGITPSPRSPLFLSPPPFGSQEVLASRLPDDTIGA